MSGKQIFMLMQIMLLMGSLSSVGQSSSLPKPQSKPSSQEKIPTVSYCELIKNPNLAGEVVRVKATWVYGFEWTYLYDRECMEQPRAWVEFDEEENLCAGTLKRSRKLNKEAYKADVMMVGVLHGGAGAHFGHENGYNFQFVVTCLEKAQQIPIDVP